MGDAEQWTLKVKIAELDRGSLQVKNRWEKGESVTVQIEPHATIGMLKQRVALLLAAHEKWQTMKKDDLVLDNNTRIDSIEGVTNGSVIDVYAVCPKEEEEDLGELSDDPDAMAPEEDELPGMPDEAAMDTELTEEQEDKQNKLKGEAAEALEDGEKAKALEKLTEAIKVGNPNAMTLSKRGELLLKMKRPLAAIADATAALKKNPDSAKAYKLRGKANRFLSKWEEAVSDFAACQQIDYDDDIADMHKFCTKRKVWHSKMAARKAKAEAAAAAEEKK